MGEPSWRFEGGFWSAGDVYVSSEPVYQEKIVQVLERHGITIDRITTTPTASDQPLEGKDSMERGHKVLSCRTSMATTKVPEIKLTLKASLHLPSNFLSRRWSLWRCGSSHHA